MSKFNFKCKKKKKRMDGFSYKGSKSYFLFRKGRKFQFITPCISKKYICKGLDPLHHKR